MGVVIQLREAPRQDTQCVTHSSSLFYNAICHEVL